MTGGKIRSNALSSQIPMMLYQKMLTGIFVGAVFQRLMCRFIGHCLQTWTSRIILLRNLTAQEHRNSTDWHLGPPKKLFACPRPTDRLVRPDCKSFFFNFFFFLNFFIQIQNYIIRKHYWNCQQSIAHVRIGNWEFRSLQDWIRHSLIFMTIISGVGNTVANMADAMDTTDVCTRSP